MDLAWTPMTPVEARKIHTTVLCIILWRPMHPALSGVPLPFVTTAYRYRRLYLSCRRQHLMTLNHKPGFKILKSVLRLRFFPSKISCTKCLLPLHTLFVITTPLFHLPLGVSFWTLHVGWDPTVNARASDGAAPGAWHGYEEKDQYDFWEKELHSCFVAL